MRQRVLWHLPLTTSSPSSTPFARRSSAAHAACSPRRARRAVFGEGDPGADLLFVGEAPGYHEDQQGRPFVGQAGKLLEQLLASIGMTREQVYIANVLKSRPPNNRDPRPEEIDACRPYLYRQIEIIRPKVICTLGNFATKLLTGDPRGITQVHGRPQVTEIAGHELYLFPIFHPAAALYTPSNLATLKEDFLRLPDLLAHAAPQAVSEPGRPAWRPPERLRPQAPVPAAAPTLADASPARDDAAPAVSEDGRFGAHARRSGGRGARRHADGARARRHPARFARARGRPLPRPPPAPGQQRLPSRIRPRIPPPSRPARAPTTPARPPNRSSSVSSR